MRNNQSRPWAAATAARSAAAAEKRENAVRLYRAGVGRGMIAYRPGYPLRTVSRYLQDVGNG